VDLQPAVLIAQQLWRRGRIEVIQILLSSALSREAARTALCETAGAVGINVGETVNVGLAPEIPIPNWM